MSINIILIILAVFIASWLYALLFDQSDEVPTGPAHRDFTFSFIYQLLLKLLLIPLLQLWRMVKAVYRFLYWLICEVIGEMIIWGMIRVMWWLIKGFFHLLTRILD